MKKIFILLFLSYLLIEDVWGQSNKIDSLWHIVNSLPEEEDKIIQIIEIAYLYRLSHPDSTVYLAQNALERAQKIHFKKGEAWAYNRLGVGYLVLGKLPLVLEYLQNGGANIQKNKF